MILTGAVAGGVLLLILGGISLRKTLTKKVRTTPGQNPVCSLSGDIRNPRAEKQGFENLSSMVRLHFAVSTEEDCRQLCSQYCNGRVSEGFIPNLKMTFRANPRSRAENFSITGHCVFEKLAESD